MASHFVPRALLPPFAFEGAETPMRPIPAVGAHTDRIPKELGCDEGTIEAWRASQVI